MAQPAASHSQRSVSSYNSPTPPDAVGRRSPSPATFAEIMGKGRPEVEKPYWDLIELGGTPAWPLEVTFLLPKKRQKYNNVIEFWLDFANQKRTWMRFRRFQRDKRKFNESFDTYQREVIEYRQREGIEGDIRLHIDYQQQNRVDE